MKIFLVSDSKTPINFFPLLENELKQKIADLDLGTVFVPFPEDIPAAVNEVLDEADLVFVFVLYEEMSFKIQSLLSKLIDLDMKGKTKIVKVIEEDDLENNSSTQLEEEKEKLAEKWGQFILNRLFKPEKFKPEEKPSTSLFSL